jgi:hypothetical protein
MGEGSTYLVTRDSRLVSRIPDFGKDFLFSTIQGIQRLGTYPIQLF